MQRLMEYGHHFYKSACVVFAFLKLPEILMVQVR
jgi:hypothetical protein